MTAPVCRSVSCRKQDIRGFTEELVLAYVVNFRVDEVGPVLLHSRLDEVGGEAVPDEVHQGVLGRHVLLGMVGWIHFVRSVDAVPGLDGDDQDDAEDDGQDGGEDVVEDRSESHFPGERQIHGA